ncbi:hypothetical protein [Mycolicibacterium sp. CBMA 226]|uniref:hypothetical protein n=1 Tax=Mycolicibacterium sp. CBMA 226 TaxID=2606611 RepID=UPI00130BF15D|nr:hypothetical protein [Mycolicibacterium sp. CBMA 226]MUL75715.1 hypothetical protein [Mycolicibacterium sp. CBMA 226]
MGDLPAITDTGRHARANFRRVDPPCAVEIDLGTLFPRQPHRSGGYQAGGLQMHLVVRGQLICWGRSVESEWWGLVTYPIAFGLQQKTVTHWIPAWVLRPNATVRRIAP